MSCEQEQAKLDRARTDLAAAEAARDAAHGALDDFARERDSTDMTNGAKSEFGFRPDFPSKAENELMYNLAQQAQREFQAKKDAFAKAVAEADAARQAFFAAETALAECLKRPKGGGLAPPSSRRWLVGGALGGVAAIVAGVAVMTQPGHPVARPSTTATALPPAAAASPPAAAAPLNQPLVIKVLKASLSAPLTTYTVAAADSAGGQLSFSWTMTPTSPDGRCGTPLVAWTRPGEVVTWSHSNGPPDMCRHLGTDHPVEAEVTVKVLSGRDAGVTAICILVGSESQTIETPETACRFSL